MEKQLTIPRVARRVVNAVNPASTTAPAKAEIAPVLANSLPPVPVENKKGYNLFKNPQGRWELQLNRRGGRVSKTVYNSEDDAKSVIELLGLDKK